MIRIRRRPAGVSFATWLPVSQYTFTLEGQTHFRLTAVQALEVLKPLDRDLIVEIDDGPPLGVTEMVELGVFRAMLEMDGE